MPYDSIQLRENLIACLPSLVIEEVAAESGQRVVYFGHFEDQKIPCDVVKTDERNFLHGWEEWGRVVIKVVSDISANSLARLQAETEILSDLRPANFPNHRYSNLFNENPITDERLPERLYVSIEDFVPSETLANIMGSFYRNEKLAAKLCLGITNALLPLWMHRRKFVHRDIKPENILIKPSGEIVIIDLGIVRETGSIGLTSDGWGKSPLTLDYAAPEQIANEKDAISYKTDFFAIGVLMYQLIAGKHPFRIRNNMDNFELAESVERYHPPTLFELGLADALTSSLIEWLMQKEPWKRPRTPSLLIDSINKILTN